MNWMYYIFAAATIEREDVENFPTEPRFTGATIDGALQLVFAVGGAIAMIVIVLGAFKYVVSLGNPEATARAKNTIIYALIGLLASITAYGIVGLVMEIISS